MNELPQPMAPQNSNVPMPSQSQPAQLGTSDAPQAVDAKILLERATEQIESTILQTATNPYERANQVHAIKTAFLRARHGVEAKDGS
ncbi:hypothetical protein IPL68_04115 [Candidatus Saccharibacteria bacterium]|nr:MAG: hypothetical protein IPL68_04115 [Candidatus Saccharibacteria bacterium]